MRIDIWSLGCVLYHMAALVPPFYTPNLFALTSKICEGEFDRNPLTHYSERISQIISKCLTVDPVNRPDICGIAQLCTERLMSYTDRSCTTIQSLEKRLRQRDDQREIYLLKQQTQLQQQQSHPRCLSCSSTKESLVNSSGGMQDMSFDGTDGQHELNKQESFTLSKIIRITFVFFFKAHFGLVSDSDTLENIPSGNIPQPPSSSTKPNNLRRQPIRFSSDQSANATESNSIYQARSPESPNISFENGYDSNNNNNSQAMHHSLSFSSSERK